MSDNSSIIDFNAYDNYAEDTKPIGRFQRGLTSMANRYVSSNPARPEIAACTLSWLKAWADDDALMGNVNRMGESVRKWALSPIALSYIQIRDEPSLNARQKRAVESWIRRVATAVVNDFSRDTDLSSRRNNHLYWAAWGVASAAAALNDVSMFDWAMERARYGIAQIEPDGTLPLELARGPMAMNYHIFAAMPLTMLAEIGEKNGVDLYHENDKGVRRLSNRILNSLDDPAFFVKRTGAAQDLSRSVTSGTLAWLELYDARSSNLLSESWLKTLRPMRQARMGGNATLLYRLP
jgi:poly(beta-D-mannuronate) lyase